MSFLEIKNDNVTSELKFVKKNLNGSLQIKSLRLTN